MSKMKTIDDPSSARSVGCIGSCEEAATQDGSKEKEVEDQRAKKSER